MRFSFSYQFYSVILMRELVASSLSMTDSYQVTNTRQIINPSNNLFELIRQILINLGFQPNNNLVSLLEQLLISLGFQRNNFVFPQLCSICSRYGTNSIVPALVLFGISYLLLILIITTVVIDEEYRSMSAARSSGSTNVQGRILTI